MAFIGDILDSIIDDVVKRAEKRESMREYQREWRRKNPGYHLEWRRKNPEYDRERIRALTESQRESLREYQREYQRTHRTERAERPLTHADAITPAKRPLTHADAITPAKRRSVAREKASRYHHIRKRKFQALRTSERPLTHADAMEFDKLEKARLRQNERTRKWSRGHRKETAEYRRGRMATDIQYRLKRTLRRRVQNRLKENSKSASTMELIGCTAAQCKAHLEAQFVDGMTWANHGDWHIDHIRPCASFDLAQQAEQRLCFNYTNLQPLWAADNIAKGAKWEM